MDDPTDIAGPAGRIGAPCLEFVNTVDWHAGDHPVEGLREYGDLVRWAHGAGLLTAEQTQQALAAAAGAPAEAQRVLEQAWALREALYRVLVAVTRQAAAPAADMAHLNAWIGRALAHACLAPAADGFAWGWQGEAAPLDAPLWPVVRSAGDLLTGAQLVRLRQCADATCGWFFLDASKNGSRRWCSMAGCGSRAKARRYYRRTHPT